MGVKDLWCILSPVATKSTLCELQGKTVAIDLSGWVCENQIVGDKCASSQPRMYLRNLFFRTSLLLMLDVKPVFVLDGEAPLLKADTLEARQGKGKGESGGNVSRRRLKGLLGQCRTLLNYMGVSCVQGEGEAEATCAWLDQQGLVDGVITQDSDTFLYGARTVYRNFTIQAGVGSVEVYKMDDIEGKLHLTREKLISLSLMCGCDYNIQGVSGVGKETAFRFLVSLETNVLDHLRGWRSNKVLGRLEKERNSCSKCSHDGKPREHLQTGCKECETGRGCTPDTNPSSYRNQPEDKQKMINLELSLRRKALANDNFPDEDVIHEYLRRREGSINLQDEWHCPNVGRFISYAEKMLNWEPEYSFEKFLPLSVRWSLLNPSLTQYSLEAIVKKRTLKGIPSLEVTWTVTDENLTFLTQQVTTIEPQVLVSRNYSTEVDKFFSTKKKKVAAKKKKAAGERKSKPKESKEFKEPLADVVHSMAKLSIEVEGSKNTNSLQEEKVEELDEFTKRIRGLLQQGNDSKSMGASQSASERTLRLSEFNKSDTNGSMPEFNQSDANGSVLELNQFNTNGSTTEFNQSDTNGSTSISEIHQSNTFTSVFNYFNTDRSTTDLNQSNTNESIELKQSKSNESIFDFNESNRPTNGPISVFNHSSILSMSGINESYLLENNSFGPGALATGLSNDNSSGPGALATGLSNDNSSGPGALATGLSNDNSFGSGTLATGLSDDASINESDMTNTLSKANQLDRKDNTVSLDDSTTQDYDVDSSFDVSLIVNQIVSRKRFY